MKREAAFILTAFMGAAFAWSQTIGTPTGPKIQPAVMMPGPNFEALKQTLGLTDSQVQQLQNLQKTRQAASQAIYQQIATKQKQLNDLLSSGTSDPIPLGQLEIDMANLRKQASTPISIRDQALAILNDGQRAKLADLQNALRLQRAAGEAMGLGLIDPLPAPAGGFRIQQ